MGRIWNWVKKHVRPYVKLHKKPNDYGGKDEDLSLEEKVEDAKDRTEVGFKLTFKF
jgi:hypothetical protein